jgi:hypothetical protein
MFGLLSAQGQPTSGVTNPAQSPEILRAVSDKNVSVIDRRQYDKSHK